MSASIGAGPPGPAAGPGLARPRLVIGASPGRAIALLPLGRGAGLLFGTHGGRLPRRAQIGAATGATVGQVRLTAWADTGDAGEACFLAALQFAAAPPAAGAMLTLQARDQPPRPLAAWPGTAALPEAFAEALAAQAGTHAAEIVLFLAELAAAAPHAERLRSVLAELLQRIATPDGAVEVVGRSGRHVLLQGWGRACDLGEVVLTHPVVARVGFTGARFSRADVPPPACGVVELLADPHGTLEPNGLGHVYAVGDGRVWRREVIAGAQCLDAARTAAHIAAMLPRLEGTGEALLGLRDAARPNFQGHETLGGLPRPVAVALDSLVTFHEAGSFVSGWLLDPTSAVARVRLGGGSGGMARLDDRWIRIPRPDVGGGVQPPGRAGAEHGFAAFLPDFTPDDDDDRLHVEVELRTGEVGFLPARAAGGSHRERLREVARNVDLHKPSGLRIATEAMAPLLLRAAAMRPAVASTLRLSGPAAPTALLLALPTAKVPPAVALAGLLADPPMPGEEALVLVLGPAWAGAPLANLQAACTLYGLQPTITLAEEPVELPEAWDLGALAMPAERYLCLGGAGQEGPVGWRRRLADAMPDGPAVVAPVLLFEDGSVRSAGIEVAATSDTPPFVRFRGPGIGLPAIAAAAGEAPRPVPFVALEGAMVSAAALRLAGGFARFGLTAAGQAAMFALQLRAASVTAMVLPGVAVVAPESAGGAEPWRTAARLAEGFALRRIIEQGVAA